MEYDQILLSYMLLQIESPPAQQNFSSSQSQLNYAIPPVLTD